MKTLQEYLKELNNNQKIQINNNIIIFNDFWKRYQTRGKYNNYPGEEFKTLQEAVNYCEHSDIC